MRAVTISPFNTYPIRLGDQLLQIPDSAVRLLLERLFCAYSRHRLNKRSIHVVEGQIRYLCQRLIFQNQRHAAGGRQFSHGFLRQIMGQRAFTIQWTSNNSIYGSASQDRTKRQQRQIFAARLTAQCADQYKSV